MAFPRSDGIIASLTQPDMFEWMDGLSYLRGHGVCPAVLDSSHGVPNPGRKRGPLWAGIDLFRFFLTVILTYRRFDVLISVDAPSCLLFV